MSGGRETRLVGALVASAFLGVAGPAAAEDAPTIHLQPAGVASTAARGLRMGPFTIANLTGRPYSMRVMPVLLGQRRDGGLFVRQDPASLVAAGRTLGADARAFDFPSGDARDVIGRVRRVPPGRGVYGGILFRATPRARGGQLVQILQLDARVMLAPRHPHPRLAAAGGPRAEQAGIRRLQVLVPIFNRGNVLARAVGDVRVRDATGRAVARVHLRGVQVLPGATVDLAGRLAHPGLAPGRYTLDAHVGVPGRDVRASAPLDLFGVDTVRTQAAKLVSLGTPRAYRGQEVDVKAGFRNTGNVDYAPQARLELRRLVAGGRPGGLVAAAGMDADRVGPGRTGELRGSVKVPAGRGSYELRVRLVQSGRELDARTVDVTALKPPPLVARLRGWVVGNAMLIVLLLLGVIAVGGAMGLRYVVALRGGRR